MENLPIDIHYNKLLDWLVSRRHCNQQWHVAVLLIREKIQQAVDELPENEEIKEMIQDADVNYFHCQKIIDILKETSLGEKNMFGQYSSQIMKEWSKIIKMYEKDSHFLAETSQMIARNVNYEIPALKKQVVKCQQIQKDCDKKEAEYVKKAAEQRKIYDRNCKELGIKGDKIKTELAELVADVPKAFEEIATSTKELKSSVTYYQDFTGVLLGNDIADQDCLPVLKLIQDKGNVTTYEWKYGTKPEQVEENKCVIDTSDETTVVTDIQEAVEDIDWGEINLDTDEPVAEIDFDMSNITIESGGTDEGKGTIDLSVEQLGEEIDWGDTGNNGDVVIVEKSEVGVAAGEDALAVLDNPNTRNLFLDDLYELEAFLAQRVVELQTEGNFVSANLLSSAPPSVQLDLNKVETMLVDVKIIIEKLMSKQLQHLMLIRNSPRYVDRLKDNLKQMLALADKMVFYEKEMVIKRNQAVQEESEVQPSIDKLVQKTKEMKKQVEVEISKKYKDRQVNIIGEVNTI